MDKSDTGLPIQLHKEVLIKKINCKQHSHIE